MSDSPPRYNSRIIDTYLKLLQKSYPHTDIPELLHFAGMKSYQVSDSGHWFSQEQVDRFYDKVLELSGDPDIAREAGRYAASADSLGILRHYVLGTLGPAQSFSLISKAAPLLTRSAAYRSRRLSARSVEVTVTPYPGVKEKIFQCQNRLGWFEAAVRIFDQQVDKIEHPQCLFRGDPVCRYLITWKRSDTLPWKWLRNLSLLALLPLFVPLFVFPSISSISILFGGGLISSVLALLAEVEEKKRLKAKVSKIQEESNLALSRLSTNHDNAVLIDEVGRAISQETDIDAVLERVVEILSKRLDFNRVMIFLASPDRTRLELHVGHGFSQRMIDQVRDIALSIDLSDPKGLIARTFLEQEPVLVENLEEWRESFSPEGYRLVKKLGSESFLFCPIVRNGSSMGILAAAKNGGARPLMQTDLSLIEGVSAYIGIALRNAELLETLRDHLKEIKDRDEALDRHRKNLEDEVVMRTAQMREALKSAETANRAKSEFLANMSHEIRTPLHGVLGMNELLLESGLNSQQKEFSRQIQGCAETLLQVITDILDFSKIEADKMDLEDVEFDLQWLLSDTIAPFRPKAEAKGLSLELKTSPEVPAWIKGDPLRLRQVLSNLVGNALKFTEKGSVAITVLTSSEVEGAPDSSLEFVVRDTGIGMSAKQKEAVFESFRQADGSTSRRYGGSGLGTTICRKLVELMGGRIDCESSLGEGSTFRFDIPLRPAPVPARREEADGTGGFCVTEASGRILIVEDNPVNREIIRLHLEGAGYSVVIAPEGGEAISRLRSQMFDLVLMDIQMPGMDGYETTRRIRRGEGGPSNTLIPVVALTANATATDRQRCLDVGMNDVIVKPVRKRDFLEKVHRYLIQSGEGEPQQVAPMVPESATEPLLFEDALEEFGSDGEVLRELISLFLRDTEVTLERIECARTAGDTPTISALAHGIKGTAGLLFALPLSRAARDLEESASSGVKVDETIEEVKIEFQRLQRCWKEWESLNF